jgi:alkanesulfonate monooxygenase SsuD/methylene tetrahydromethanopterin reductase-like flavin-dependent oxidoreductase (luciferase family)
VARFGDACNFGGPWDAITPEQVRQRLALLAEQCAAQGRPYEEILRTHLSMLVMAPSEARLQAKLARFFRDESVDYMQQLGWLVAGTPGSVAEYYAARAEAGMQYFITHLADTADEETMTLLAERVLPDMPSRY